MGKQVLTIVVEIDSENKPHWLWECMKDMQPRNGMLPVILEWGNVVHARDALESSDVVSPRGDKQDG